MLRLNSVESESFQIIDHVHNQLICGRNMGKSHLTFSTVKTTDIARCQAQCWVLYLSLVQIRRLKFRIRHLAQGSQVESGFEPKQSL